MIGAGTGQKALSGADTPFLYWPEVVRITPSLVGWPLGLP